MRRSCLLMVLASAMTLAGCAGIGNRSDSPAATIADNANVPMATGYVFEDRNTNGMRDAGERGLKGVLVSNGREVVATNRKGQWRLPVDDDTIFFVIKPRGWMTPTDPLNLPRFYYIHKPNGSPAGLKYPGVAPTGPLPASIDFPLQRHKEPDRFNVLVFGDTQPTSVQQVDYLAHDVIEEVVGIDAAFGITLGDLVNNQLELFDPLNRAVAHVGVPFYNVQGNHDLDHASPDDVSSDDEFERVYGPSHYSFNYGPVHFVVLDDVIWHGETPEEKGHYNGGLGEEQFAFLRNDLAHVPKEQLVVLTMHIPIVEMEERKELFEILAQRPHLVSFSAHTHVQQQMFLGEEHDWPAEDHHHHINFATACGSWWTGMPDEVGIPHTTMRDGAPNGWSLVTFDRNQYSVVFKAARRPADYQMNIQVPDGIAAGEAGGMEVLVNVFAGSERSTVEMRFMDGPWVELERVELEDPYYAATAKLEETNPPPGHKLPKVVNSRHIWRGKLPPNPPAGTHLIEVRTTDVFGQTFTGRRIVRIE